MKNFVSLVIALVIGMCTSNASADIVYRVNRTIDQGTVIGYITTDGTLGVLSTGNIVDWELTLTAPNLLGGSQETIDFATQAQTLIVGTTVTASETELLFDISGGSGEGVFILQGSGNRNHYCLETAAGNCTGSGIGEHIGFDSSGNGTAQSALPTGNFVFAHTAITYKVNRMIDQGTITGIITTDGTMGVLNSSNIIDWELRLTAPNLQNGPTDTISIDAKFQTNLSGSTTTATATQLLFDISGGSGVGFFLLQGDNSNFWCLETDLAGCAGADAGERMGRNDDGSLVAQTDFPAGNIVIASTTIRYTVNRIIGAGTITGFIETDGTIGPLQSSNITDWELTLTAPNLFNGSPNTISFDTNLSSIVTSTNTTATTTDIFFDITGASGNGSFLLQGGSFNYWCIETALSDCTGNGIGEHLGFDTDGAGPAQTGQPTGNFVIASTKIKYVVNRVVDQGTITGFIETDGTLGILESENITDWELTLTAPNLLGGSPDVIHFDNQVQTFISGNMTTATPTDLFFDISGDSDNGFFLVQGAAFGNFWCLETADTFCTSEGMGEHIGHDANGPNVAQTGQPTGNFAFASVVDPITYQVNRTIDAGTITGFIQTDGTLGELATANIINWALTLTAPNLQNGSPDEINFSTGSQTGISGMVVTASSTSLIFDFSGASGDGVLLLQGANFGNYWCIETEFAGCTGAGIGEHMGFNADGTTVAQTALPGTPLVIFASNCPADLTGDGILNFFDISAFLSAFAAGNLLVDYTDDGILNFFDVSSFLQQFNAGCP